MDDPARESASDLCEVCSAIDFQNMAVAAELCCKSLAEEESPAVGELGENDLGRIVDIRERAGRCKLCATITRHCSDLSGRCKLMQRLDFCISSDQPEFTREDSHIHTRIAQVQLFPDDEPVLWAPAPWELDQHKTDLQGVRRILDLQAARNEERGSEETLGIAGRRVLSYIDMALLRQWLSTCELNHVGRCPHSSTTPNWEHGFMPTFVIDVDSYNIVETPLACRYITLSYVWGQGKMFKNLSAITDTLRAPGALLTLDIPATIRDSMTLVKELGEKYLWVDAICIIQDSPTMQQSQIAKMDQIYAKALFTIVAACGDNAEAGLPGVGQTMRKQAQDVLHLPTGDFYTLLCDTSEYRNIIANSAWAHRAWTMQELLCSGRCLIFSDLQVYWRCHGAVWLEELALETAGSTDLEILPNAASAGFPDRILDRYEYFRLYERLVGFYLHRQLSYRSDMINAFSGICARLSAIHDDRFVWGLPESQFSRSLGWYIYGAQARHDSSTDVAAANGIVRTVPFPSWSWAAWTNTEIGPWLNFVLSSRWYDVHPSQEHRSGQEFHPVVDFWTADEFGLIVPIDEPGTHGRWCDTFDTDHRFPWQGSERSLPEYLCDTSILMAQRRPGLLYFWTSVAFSVHAKDLYTRPRERDTDVRCDLLVVARTDELKSRAKSLVLLEVEWDDGIAYRVRSRLVKEYRWEALPQKQWKFVSLG